MRYLYCSIFIFCITFSGFSQISDFIHVDQFGYLTNADKVAVISDPQTGYNSSDSYTAGSSIELRDATDDSVILSASPTIWDNGATHNQSGDKGWWFDFSSVTTEGTYYVYDPSTTERSGNFVINDNPYLEVLNVAFKMFYYNRCNHTKEAPYAGVGWRDGDNFEGAQQDSECRDAYDQNNAATERDLTGGWFDAGDYNKYVTFAYKPVHDLLSSYEENTSIWTDEMNIPESGNGLADILDELKWELDWLMKMSSSDGKVLIKMGSVSYSENEEAPPSANNDPRYYGNYCTSASIAIASMFAHAAKIYENESGMSGFAADLETRAIECWEYFITEFNASNVETDCDDGLVKSGDADWTYNEQLEAASTAAVYLFELTGDTEYHDFFKDHFDEIEPISNSFWGPYLTEWNDALLLYTTLAGNDNAIESQIESSASDAITNNWNAFYAFSDNDLYRSESPDWMYHWGSNLPKAGLGILCKVFKDYDLVASANDDLEEKAAEQLHYFHGINPQGLVYLSNMYAYGGDRCANQIYHTWFNDGTDWDDAFDSPNGPAPGYVSGGANKDFTVSSLSPPANQPPQKSYLDFNTGFPDNSWEITEPAIYYQSAYLRHLAFYVNTTTVSASQNILATNNCVEIFPNPSGDYFYVRGLLENYTIEILDSNGALYQTISNYGSEAIVDISNLPTGMFFISIKNSGLSEVCVQKIIKE